MVHDGRFVAYHQPTSLKVVNGRVTPADADASISAPDLTVLRARFDALITYDAIHGAQQIPAIAARLKFRALIIGVWDPADEAQLERHHRTRGRSALSAARLIGRLPRRQRDTVLFSTAATPQRLLAAIASVRTRAPAATHPPPSRFTSTTREAEVAAVLGELAPTSCW